MEKIELREGTTLEEAALVLLSEKLKGNHVYCEFAGHKLFSDDITMDKAHLIVYGVTRKIYKENKELDHTVTAEKIIAGLKFIAENPDITQAELINGLMALGCTFTFDDVRSQMHTTEEELFAGIAHGDLACGAYVIVNMRNSLTEREFFKHSLLLADGDTSIYNFIRIATWDPTYTKEKIAAKNNAPKLNKSLK